MSNIRNIIYEGTYFIIEEVKIKGRKTSILKIYSGEETFIGEVKWYAPWRRFCFYPTSNTVWDSKCLEELFEFIITYNKEYIEKRLF